MFTAKTVNNYVDFDNVIYFKITIDNNITDVFPFMLDAVIDFVFFSEIVIYT
jgi:hypothetical protein